MKRFNQALILAHLLPTFSVINTTWIVSHYFPMHLLFLQTILYYTARWTILRSMKRFNQALILAHLLPTFSVINTTWIVSHYFPMHLLFLQTILYYTARWTILRSMKRFNQALMLA